MNKLHSVSIISWWSISFVYSRIPPSDPILYISQGRQGKRKMIGFDWSCTYSIFNTNLFHHLYFLSWVNDEWWSWLMKRKGFAWPHRVGTIKYEMNFFVSKLEMFDCQTTHKLITIIRIFQMPQYRVLMEEYIRPFFYFTLLCFRLVRWMDFFVPSDMIWP